MLNCSCKAWYCICVPYCPEQAPMGAHSSSTKIWGWAVTRRKCIKVQLSLSKGQPRLWSWQPWPKLTCIVSSSVLLRGQPNSGEGCIMLQSGPTRSLIAKFLQHSVVACSTWILCRKGGTLKTRPQAGVCEPDVMVPKAHQSYVSSADLYTFGFTTQEFNMVGSYTENPEKP